MFEQQKYHMAVRGQRWPTWERNNSTTVQCQLVGYLKRIAGLSMRT